MTDTHSRIASASSFSSKKKKRSPYLLVSLSAINQLHLRFLGHPEMVRSPVLFVNLKTTLLAGHSMFGRN